MKRQYLYLNADFKLILSIDPIAGLNMTDYDFSVELYATTAKKLKIKKSEMTELAKDQYLLIGNTTSIGIGDVMCMVTAMVPEADFPGTTRIEVSGFDTGITILRRV